LTEQKHARFQEPIQNLSMSTEISIELWNGPIQRKKAFIQMDFLHVGIEEDFGKQNLHSDLIIKINLLPNPFHRIVKK
jgi:hypothetical protein